MRSTRLTFGEDPMPITIVCGGCDKRSAVAGKFGGPLAGIVAVILGFVARSQGSRSGMALAGIITGFAAIVLGIVLFILSLVGVLASAVNNAGGPAPGPNRPGIQRGPNPGPGPN